MGRGGRFQVLSLTPGGNSSSPGAPSGSTLGVKQQGRGLTLPACSALPTPGAAHLDSHPFCSRDTASRGCQASQAQQWGIAHFLELPLLPPTGTEELVSPFQCHLSVSKPLGISPLSFFACYNLQPICTLFFIITVKGGDQCWGPGTVPWGTRLEVTQMD